MNHPDAPWDWCGLSRNPNLTFSIIKEHIDYPWNWYYISSHNDITWDIVINNPQYPWSIFNFSDNKNLTWEIVINNRSLQWNWLSVISRFSCGKHDGLMDFGIIVTKKGIYIDESLVDLVPNLNISTPLMYTCFVKNVTIHKHEVINICKEYYKGKLIAKQFTESVINPEYSYCRLRLEKELCNLQLLYV
jgi:hypothetical protein